MKATCEYESSITQSLWEPCCMPSLPWITHQITSPQCVDIISFWKAAHRSPLSGPSCLQIPHPPPPMLILWHGRVGHSWLTQTSQCGTIQLMQMAFEFDYLTWSFTSSCISFMVLYILYFEGRGTARLCVFCGTPCVWRSKFKIAKIVQIFL